MGKKIILTVVIAAIIGGIIYVIWLNWSDEPVKPGQVVSGKTPSAIADMPKATTPLPRFEHIKDGFTATAKVGLPAPVHSEVVPAIITTPPARYGTTSAVYTNTTTGETKVETKVNEAPWFQFERSGVIGAEIGIGPHGRYYQGDAKVDLLSIKGITLAGRGAITSYQDATEWQIGIRTEKQFSNIWGLE